MSKSNNKMEFIFELFAQMFASEENIAEETIAKEEVSKTAEFDAETEELPEAELGNIFEAVCFH